ncbi:hypothetical protein DUI87_19120 [Hirundo rustica rustica]|uniref:Reverse transcriptase domain-containing protein n=1 Tax=Hirundo rustica rustica TaxID=333673 RepID=A0A3M0JVT2_HIRRU|nr:hypothetical protein DUI87_19120 [Hirundo rustica rustica]
MAIIALDVIMSQVAITQLPYRARYLTCMNRPSNIVIRGSVPNTRNVTHIHEKGGKEDPGNYRPVSLTSVPGKVMKQFILSAIMQSLQDGKDIRPSQHGFRRDRLCLTNLASFYDEVTCLVDVGKTVDVVYLDFSKAFDSLPQHTPGKAGSSQLGQEHSFLA